MNIFLSNDYKNIDGGRMSETNFKNIKIDKEFLDFIVKFDENNLDFVKNFYGIKPSEDDKNKFKDFIRAIKFRSKGVPIYQISKYLGIPQGRVLNWIYKGSLPKIVELLKHHMKLGYHGNKLEWLSINSTSWRFKGPWITVPKNITKYSDVLNVLQQLQPLKTNNAIKKEELFAFLLGMMVGDCNKDKSHKSIKPSKRIVLELAKTKHSNLRLGDFTVLCANSLGLRMKRTKDRIRIIAKKKRRMYRWRSQLSPLIDWIVRVCLCLEEGKNTTYHPIKADWILKAPNYFKISFIQGLFESDGWVDLNTGQVGVVSGPNTNFLIKLFKSLNVNLKRSISYKYSNPDALKLKPKDAYSLPVFNPKIKSYRYSKLERSIKAKRFKKWPKWLQKKVDKHIQKGFSRIQIIEKVLNENNIAITGGNIRLRKQFLISNQNRDKNVK